jgi:phage repressor protein C with HTH and peptisase S24 domain
MGPKSFGERIRESREAKGLSQRELGRRVGLTGSAISMWESGDTDPSRLSLSTIERAAAELGKPVKWLLSGKEISVADIEAPYLRPVQVWDEPGDLPPDQYVFLPSLDYHLSAGPGGPDPNAAQVTDRSSAFRAAFALAEGWSPKTHFTMRAKGDSMEPTIQDGAPVVIATNAKTIQSGRVYALLIDGEPYLKRLDRLPGGLIRVRSDNNLNPAYAAFEVSQEKIEIIGRAVWTPVKL